MSATQAVVTSILGAVLTWLSRRRLPQVDGALRLPGLNGLAEVVRDRWGVPHIYADSEEDLFFVQGFVHAQDRLWQMDVLRRLVAGRLSEVMGTETLPVDRWLRTLGLRRVVEREATLIHDQVYVELEAYAAGVNARIARGRLPIEFMLLRYEPDPWTVADTLSWAKMMSWSLSANWEAEILRAQLIERLGPEQAAELEPGSSPLRPEIAPPAPPIGGAALDCAGAARPFTGPSAFDGLGSNNWVIGGSRTTSGAPLLANDMHLTMNIPCLWYENHLTCGDLNVTGTTFPGVPGVISGHNGRIAWGFTNGLPDVQDLYVERLYHTSDGLVQYEYQGEWLYARVLQEEIHVRGGEDVVQEVIITHHGPIINRLIPELEDEPSLALRWVSLEPDTTVEALRGMNRARSAVEFREALRHWTAPSQNVVYADVEGNIGYSLAGKVPIRANGQGYVPVPGWTGEYEWTGYIPFEELPHLYNPAHGYVATANNYVADASYPHYLGRDYCMGDRVQRITELIEVGDKVDVAYAQRMQFDHTSPSAQTVARYLGKLTVGDPELATVVEMMQHWDGTLAAESSEASVYEVFVRRMATLMLSDRLGDLTARYLGEGPVPLLTEASLFGERAWEWIQATLADPDSHWFDLGQGQTRDDVMRLALRQTVDSLRAELGPRPEDWAWGKLHKMTYDHLLGHVPLLGRTFNRGPYPVGGDGNTVWATHPRQYDLRSEGIVGPPFRFVADLSDLRNSWGLLSPGQSGQLGSPHYDDQIEAWFTGEYHPMLYTREDVAREAQARLRLEPREGFDTWLLKTLLPRLTDRKKSPVI